MKIQQFAIGLLASGILLGVTACKDDDIFESSASSMSQGNNPTALQEDQYSGLSYISPALTGDIYDRLKTLFPVSAGMNQADVIVLEPQEITNNYEQIKSLQSQNKIIAICSPNKHEMENISHLFGVACGEEIEGQNIDLIAFSSSASYTLYSPQGSCDDKYINFAHWLNNQKQSRKLSLTRNSRISPYNISLDIYANPVYVKTMPSTVLSFIYDIMPIYVNQSSKQSVSGDYYAVVGGVTLHGRSDKMAWKDVKLRYRLVNENGANVSGVHFPAGMRPRPETMTSGVSYESGVDISLNGGCGVGAMFSPEAIIPVGSIDLSFGMSWSNTQTYVLEDIEGELATNQGDVNYTYYLNNADSPCGGADVTFHNGWVWHVPSETVKDNETTSFKLDFQCTVDYLIPIDENIVNSTISFCRPDRQRYGLLKFPNFSKYMIAHIKIWKTEEYGQSDAQPVIADDDVYDMNETYSQFLKEGNYMITYDMYGEDGSTFIGHYKNKTNLVVGPGSQSGQDGGDEASSTTLVNLLNREQIK